MPSTNDNDVLVRRWERYPWPVQSKPHDIPLSVPCLLRPTHLTSYAAPIFLVASRITFLTTFNLISCPLLVRVQSYFFRMLSHWYISRSLIVGRVVFGVIPELTRYATVRHRCLHQPPHLNRVLPLRVRETLQQPLRGPRRQRRLQ